MMNDNINRRPFAGMNRWHHFRLLELADDTAAYQHIGLLVHVQLT